MKKLRQLVPESLKPIFRAVRQLLYIARFRGGEYFCPVCNKSVRRFKQLPYGDTRCFLCGSDERHRLVYSFFKQRTDLFDGKQKHMLHVAPELQFVPIFKKSLGPGYVTGDLLSRRVMVQLDVTDIQFPSEFFDVIYCSHVLEHVSDDRKAMREFHRVLKTGGYAVIMVPVSSRPTFEDPSVSPPAERLRLFGQEDHVRVYGLDFVHRLAEAGLKVDIFSASAFLSPSEIARMHITRHAGDVFFCIK